MQITINPTTQANNILNTKNTPVPTNHDTPNINEEEILPRNVAYIQQETPKTQKPNKPKQQRSNKLTIQKPKPPDTSTNSDNQTSETTEIQQSAQPDISSSLHPQNPIQPQTRCPAPSSHCFQRDVDWWLGHIKYKNCKTRRDKLAPSQLFPHTSLKERREYYEPDGEGVFLPQIRYDRLGVPTLQDSGTSEPELRQTL